MNIEFAYFDELFKFAQVLTLGAILSIVVMYIVEILKTIIITKHTNIFALLCFVISMVFGITWALTFSDGKISYELSVWLGLCLWLGSNGFFKYLENSDSWLGRTVKSYSEYLREIDIKEENSVIKELRAENEQLKQKLEELQSACGNGSEKEDSDTSSPQLPTPEQTPFDTFLFKCGCEEKYCNGYPAQVDTALLKLMEELQKKYTADIKIVSGLRCERYNAELPGGLNSKHLTGKAVDFSFDNMDKSDTIAFLNTFEEIEYVYTNSTNMKDMIHLQIK